MYFTGGFVLTWKEYFLYGVFVHVASALNSYRGYDVIGIN